MRGWYFKHLLLIVKVDMVGIIIEVSRTINDVIDVHHKKLMLVAI